MSTAFIRPIFAFLNKVKELQAAVRVLLGDRDNEAQIGLGHLVLGDARLALALLTWATILRNSPISRPVSVARAWIPRAIHRLRSESLPVKSRHPWLGISPRDRPFRVKLGALIVLQEVRAVHAIAFGKPHQPALKADQPLVDVVKLLDQRLDAVVVERQALHIRDDGFFQLFQLLGLRRGGRNRSEPVRDILVLDLSQLLIGIRDPVENLDDARFQLRFMAESEIPPSNSSSNISASAASAWPAAGASRSTSSSERRIGRAGFLLGKALLGIDRFDLGRALAVRAGIGGFQIDDVAQENLAVIQLIAPDDDGLEGERSFAQPGNHRLAAGLDALGDGNFALAREQLSTEPISRRYMRTGSSVR